MHLVTYTNGHSSKFLPSFGTKMLRCRQSSDWYDSLGFSFLRNMIHRVAEPDALATGIGKVWGQTGPWLVDSLIPDQWTGGLVGANLGKILKAYNIWAAVAAQWLSACLQSKTLEVVGSVPPGYWLFSHIFISFSSMSVKEGEPFYSSFTKMDA